MSFVGHIFPLGYNTGDTLVRGSTTDTRKAGAGAQTESPVETLEKVVGLRLIWTGGITSPGYFERHTEFKASKGDDA